MKYFPFLAVLILVFASGCASTTSNTPTGYAASEQAKAANIIDACNAGQYEGRYVTVQGRVVDVSYSSKSVTHFLNFGQPYPNNCFTAVIFRSDKDNFADIYGYEGKNVRISGTVKIYNGKPEIILENPLQIQII